MSSEVAPLERVIERYGWPTPSTIFEPSGAGPSRHAQILKQKIETSLRRRHDATHVQVGLLTRDPNADATEDPLAVVCVFPTAPLPQTLAEVHRLAWSFSRARVLLIVEPSVLRVWTCCEAPRVATTRHPFPSEIAPLPINGAVSSASLHVAQSLDWVRFTSGALVDQIPKRFADKGRADRTLLENLRIVRQELLQGSTQRRPLAEEVVHDLLARIIFIQFLFHRKDSVGRPALGQQELDQLYVDDIVSRRYYSFGDIIRSHNDVYRLFRWLDQRFNGDLFPGKRCATHNVVQLSPEQAWREEMHQVGQDHLGLLADLVDGRLVLKGRRAQLHLWPLYAFDAIPLDFISSIYEEFVGEGEGVHYTPHHLVDFVLDEVLPWNGKTWDLKILDPACGSGIFLVKSFQRLVHRWRIVHCDSAPSAEFLQGLLERCLLGIDKNNNAIRVASLSLYLAMCDEIDPRCYWAQMRLPSLYGSRLIHSDFFEDHPEFSPESEDGKFDIVVGNAPWGEETMTDAAARWSNSVAWRTPNRSIGPLFLVKSATLTRPGGFVAMLQPSGAILFNRSKVAADFRRRLFEEYEVEEVVDFSSLRRDTFEHSIAPTCAVVIQPSKPDETTVLYARARGHIDGSVRDIISIEAADIHHLDKREAANDPWVWTVLWHGTRRDLELVHRLAKRPKVASLGPIRMGIVRGRTPKLRRHEHAILGRRILDRPAFPASTFLVLDTAKLGWNSDPYVTIKDSSRLAAFAAPQILFKMAWSSGEGRFRAVAVDNDERDGVLCIQSYISIHITEQNRHLTQAACLTLNSSLAVYFLFLTGSRFTNFIPSALNKELHSVPLPGRWDGDLRQLRDFVEVDQEVFDLFQLTEIDRMLVKDFMDRLVPSKTNHRPNLQIYCEQLIESLKRSGLAGTSVALDVSGMAAFPLRVVVLYLSMLDGPSVQFETVTHGEFLDRLVELDRIFLKQVSAGSGGVLFQRVARIYDVVLIDGERVPAVYFIKPNRPRYWSRSSALDDVDALVADALMSHAITEDRLTDAST